MTPLNPYVLKSYRYLRLVMIGLVIWLGVSVLIEVFASGAGCWRTSISSYYWTPVRGVFIASLVAVGACLVIIKGNTEIEDVLLNVAGALAPIVAFVPIIDPRECQSTPWASATDGGANIKNNVGAFLIAGVLATLVAWIVARREGNGKVSRGDVIGLVVTVALVSIGIALFLFQRTFFDRWAHYLAAIPLFVVLLAVMVANAVSFARAHEGRVDAKAVSNRYLLVAVVTLGLVALMGAVTWLRGWDHATFWIEVVVIGAFVVFWTLQTLELWDAPEGVRADPGAGDLTPP